MLSNKLSAGAQFPTLSFPKQGGGTLSVGGTRENWTLFLVYRGKHCGRCIKHFNKLETMKVDWEDAGFSIVTVSADPQEKANAIRTEQSWTFDIGYDLTQDQMRELCLYITDPLTPQETDRRFAEPAVFCIRPDGTLQIISISNGPAARTDLEELLDGMIFTIKGDRPARGLVE